MVGRKPLVDKVKLPKKKRKPCEPPSSQKKHKNHRRCKWQFGRICTCYPSEMAYKKGFALFLDRDEVTDEMCKKWFMPVDDSLVAGELHYCRRESAFIEIETAKKATRVRNKKKEVVGLAPILFGQETNISSLVHRPESGDE